MSRKVGGTKCPWHQMSVAPNVRGTKCPYVRLLSKGKAKKVALVAVMRKLLVTLNTMVKTGRSWSEPTLAKEVS